MAQKKAFVRYAQNKAVPGSLIVRTKAPKVGTWKEVPYDVCCDGGGPCTAPVVLTAPLNGETNRGVSNRPLIACTFPDSSPILMSFGFLGSAPNDTWVNIINDANETLSWIGTWELGENQIILTMDCNFYTFLQTLCLGEIELVAASPA